MNTISNIQVCFVTTTQYQFMIADIYARYIFDNYGIQSTICNRSFPNFDTEKFETNGKYEMIPYTVHNKNIFGQCIFALRCGYLYRFSKWSKILDPQKKILLFVFNDISKLANRLMMETKKYSKDNQVYIVEEGNSTYSDSVELKNEKLWRLKHQVSKLIFGYGRTSKVIGESSEIDGAIVKDINRYRKLKKSKNQKIIQQNPEILQYAGDFFDHYGSAASDSIDTDIIYLGQPFYQNGKYFKYENDCIEAAISSIPKQFNVLIKPHPRDLIKKYEKIISNHKNVSMIREDLSAIPIEALLDMTKAKVAIAIQSSAAITIADLYPDICSIVLKNTPEALLMLEKLKELGDEGPVYGDDAFVGKNNNIFILETMDECAQIIEKGMNRNIDNEKTRAATKDVEFKEMDYIIAEMKGQHCV